jgi:hypothetical protein
MWRRVLRLVAVVLILTSGLLLVILPLADNPQYARYKYTYYL